MLHTCTVANMRTRSMFVLLSITLLFALEVYSKPLPTYFRYELLKSGALTHLVVGDFNGDGYADIGGLMSSQRTLVVMYAKGKLAFRPHQSVSLSSRAQSLFALNVAGEKHTSLAVLVSSPSRAQLWRLGGSVGKLLLDKRAEILLPDGTERLYLSKQHSADKPLFFARTETGTLTTFSFQAKDGFSKATPLSLSHRVSEVILPTHSTSDFFTQVVGESTLWLHRSPPSSLLPIRCKESVSIAATGDFNRNDVLDLVVVQAAPNGKTVVEVIFDVGVETGVAPIRFETPLNPKQIFLSDFNADGLLDIGLCDGFSFAIHFAQSPTAFLEGMIIAFSDNASGVAVADLNQDGKVELIVSEQKTGKLVAYSTSHHDFFGVERLATSGEPAHLAFHSARKQMLIGCNRYQRIEHVQFERQPAHIGSFSTTGKIVSLWQDDVEMNWLTTSPVTLARKRWKSEAVISHRLFSLGVSQSLLWRASNGQPALLALLEERVAGAVPQLLFYALNRDSTLSICELLLDTPISAENIVNIGGATLKNKHYLVVLNSEKNAHPIVVYELQLGKNRLRLVEVASYALPTGFAMQKPTFLLVRVNKHETMDFLVARSQRAVVLLSERLYQPQQISNFPKINASDVMLWSDSNGDDIADLFISRHQRTDVLLLRGHSNGKFDVPKVILSDVVATGIASVVSKHHATLFVTNAKLHTVDILHLKK